MDTTAFPYSLYEEVEVIDDAEHTVFKCASWQSSSSVLTSAIGTITYANIVGVMITSKENWFSVANYMKQIVEQGLDEGNSGEI